MMFPEEQPTTPMETHSTDNSKEAPSTASSATQAEVEALKQQLEEAKAQAQEYLAGWQRTMAEFDNYRKRVAAQEEQTRQRIRAEVLKTLLEIADDMERALEDPNRPRRGKAREWAQGIELIYDKIRHLLQMQGVEPIPAEPGQPFDPFWHEAVGFVEDSPYEEGHIAEVVRKGYRVGDLVIRPALVKVAR